ncbi:MAG: SDR family oxidoreductase [Clostridiales bacterium]|jgi:NAD(P)-dependent dehydrogenase (short-subunit alcohol dehydrogenase family)|nr:SDR family oxidoreductase [Eubacteriales bacterium]MDD4711292.1 SDR family oxidoreductase [Eubacteriales bacterium]NLA52858.1 SDR family oxidoreductase [Clostridiales bacterium]NLO16177.1 SDR family oxidoreductase [Clostridiales bacterium]
MDNNKGYFLGKNAVVTGAASGVGLALCEELLSQGAGKVVLADINEENLHTHEKRLQLQYLGRIKGVRCDVTKENEVQQMIDEAVEFMDGRFDLLINNAGLGLSGLFTPTQAGEVLKEKLHMRVQTNEDWERAFKINFYGALYGCRAAINVMIPQGGGQVVNIISGIAWSPMAYQSMYAATKAALNMLTLTLRYEYWDEGIKFNSATPGTTLTAIWGEIGPPEGAQTAQESARKVLKGVAENQRLILGDKGDEEGAPHCFDPSIQDGLDSYFLNVARVRRGGKLIV